MKILFVVGSLGLGGAERQVLVLAQELAQIGHQISIAVFRDGGAMQADAVARGASIIVLGGRNPLQLASRLRALIASDQPDIVHGYLTAGNIVSLVARLTWLRPAVVWGVRASDMHMQNYGMKWRVAAWLERRLCSLADLVIVNSQAGDRVLREQGLHSEKIAVIENGIDLSRFQPAAGVDDPRRRHCRALWNCAPNVAVIGHVARMDPMKDHATFLSALLALRQQRGDWRAVLIAVGAEPDRAALRDKVVELGLSDHVVITGPQAEIADAYAGFDLFCSSSAYGEGFSNVIAEALASGLPVVATDVGDARRIVGTCGVVVPARDAEALALAIEDVLQRHGSLAPFARDQLAPFSLQTLAKRTEEALEATLRAKRR